MSLPDMKNKISIGVMVFGALIAILSICADFIGLGKSGGVPAVQFLGAQVGVIIALIGVGFYIRQKKNDPIAPGFGRGPLDKILNQPVFTWVVIGFVIAYILFFIFPTFLNPQGRFQYSTGFLPEREHIGFDTRLILDHIQVWFSGEREAKYIYSALTTILFTPLLLLRYPANYYVATAVTLVSYFILNLLLPLWIGKKENRPLLFFVFAVSIFSYGLQFELETGQFYTLAMMLSVSAIYIFHRHPSYRIFAYILFCVSIQLKVFPAIFIVMFVDDWRDWKSNLKRLAALGFANFLLLFLLGLSYLNTFLNHLIANTNTSELAYNHSIFAFTASLPASSWVGAAAVLSPPLLYAYFLLCFIVVLVRAYVQNTPGIHANLLMVCLIGGLTLPAISHDYNLPLLATPFVLVMSAQYVRDALWAKIVSIVLITSASFAYSATLFPSNARPAVLENSFPALFILLTAVTMLSFMQKKENVRHVIASEAISC